MKTIFLNYDLNWPKYYLILIIEKLKSPESDKRLKIAVKFIAYHTAIKPIECGEHFLLTGQIVRIEIVEEIPELVALDVSHLDAHAYYGVELERERGEEHYVGDHIRQVAHRQQVVAQAVRDQLLDLVDEQSYFSKCHCLILTIRF